MRLLALIVWCVPAMIATGCATGGMLTSLNDEPLPLEENRSPYPTAIQAIELEGGTAFQSEVPAKQVATSLALANRQEAVPAHSQIATPAPPAAESVQSPASTNSEPAGDKLPNGVARDEVQGSPTPPPTTAQPALPPAILPPQQTSVQPITLSPEDRLAAIAQQRDVLIAMLRDDIQSRKAAVTVDSGQELPRLEEQLRLLYAAADRPDDAILPIDSLHEADREAYTHMMAGLTTWFGHRQSSRSPSQAAQVLYSLREASTELTAISKLELRNLAFCERVQSFGWFTEFTRNEFQPKQQVILYVEVDYFTAQQKGPYSFETELQGHYQIFDARGQIVAERKLPLDREVCRNLRRDYFLAYPIYLPEAIEPGRYRLELTVEDLKVDRQYQGRKFGEASIEFVVKS